MKSSKNLWMMGAALTLMGCNGVDLAFVPLFAIAPEVTVDTTTNITTCVFNPDGDPLPFIGVDVNSQAALSLMVSAENRLQEVAVTLQSGGPASDLVIPNHIQPLRFDYRWECESDGFTAGQGPLRLPAFGADRAFCFDKRDDTTGNFSGFNVVPATGASIPANSTGAIEVRIAPPQLIESIRDAFEISVLANSCCAEAGSCSDATTRDPQTDTTVPSCLLLQQVFDRVGGNLTTTDLRNLTQWRSFAAHTGAATPISDGNGGTIVLPVPYNMRLRGRFEALTATGDLITSSDFAQDVGFCANCLNNVSPAVSACLNR